MKLFSAISLVLSMAFCFSVSGQEEVIHLKNPSFEGIPKAGGSQRGISAAGWIDCGAIKFPGETPPDIHPGNFFRVQKKAQDGQTYVGLVARENDSWESVSQLLNEPLKQGNCYSMNLYLSRSDNYVNKDVRNQSEATDVKSQSEALVLRVYGGLRPCEKKQLLAESSLISHTDWRNYELEFKAKANIYYLTFEAFYKTPVLVPYNGNLLIDNISPIKQTNCPGEDPVIADTPTTPQTPATPTPPKKEEVKPAVEVVEETVPEPVYTKPKKEKLITQELNNAVAAGQTIQINKLYFEADTTSINTESYSALNELYDFLTENPAIRIEIGGHTNGNPPHEYCDRLSTNRAKEVATYMIRKGIKASRLEYMGYGKRKPIASNKTKEGRKRNQRVEITILNVE